MQSFMIYGGYLTCGDQRGSANIMQTQDRLQALAVPTLETPLGSKILLCLQVAVHPLNSAKIHTINV